MSTAMLERTLADPRLGGGDNWYRMESPLLFSAPPRFRLLETPVTIVDDLGEEATAVGVPCDDEDFEVL